DGRRLFGPLGPDQMASGDFPDSWSGWYENMVRAWGAAIDPWSLPSGSTQAALDAHRQDEKRVRGLARSSSGPFAVAALADWEAVEAVLAGEPATLGEHALDFRRLGEQRAADVAAAGKAARKAFLAAHGKDLVPAFPAVDPKGPDRASVA